MPSRRDGLTHMAPPTLRTQKPTTSNSAALRHTYPFFREGRELAQPHTAQSLSAPMPLLEAEHPPLTEAPNGRLFFNPKIST